MSPFLALHFSYFMLMTFLMILSVLLLSILMRLSTQVIRYNHLCDQAFDLWQQLELAAELESELLDTGLGQKVACQNLIK